MQSLYQPFAIVEAEYRRERISADFARATRRLPWKR